jgi:hypothetical protein
VEQKCFCAIPSHSSKMALRPQPNLVVRISDFDNEVKAIIGTYSLDFLPTYLLVTLLLKRQVVFVSRG